MQTFGDSLWYADGDKVSFFGFPYPTRMAIVRLENGDLWLWSPVALTEELGTAVDALGPVSHLVSPNKIHHLFLDAWMARYPDARVYASPGLGKRRPDLDFDAELDDQPAQDWAGEIDQVIFHGSVAMEEVVFFHRRSRTALVCDLIQRHDEDAQTGWRGALMKLDGLVGEHGSTPREWRASFLRRAEARAARETLLSWQPERLLIAHGELADSGAAAVIEESLAWLGN
jgi:hypothetical protein